MCLRVPAKVLPTNRSSLSSLFVYNTSGYFPFGSNLTQWSMSSDKYRLEEYLEVERHFFDGFITYDRPENIALMSLYSVVFVFALFGNIFVIIAARSNSSMRRVTSYFLLNLAVSDLLVTVVCIPFTVCELVSKFWMYGEFLCKATNYLQGVSVGSSVLTIMFLSLDRYFAIKYPVKSRRMTTTCHVTAVVILIWSVSCGLMAPLAVTRSIVPVPHLRTRSVAFCLETWSSPEQRQMFGVFLFVFVYVLPGIVVSVSYTSTGRRLIHGDRSLRHQGSVVYRSVMAGRRRVARMLLLLAILFAVSWMPYYVVTLYGEYTSHRSRFDLGVVLSFSLLLGHSHSAQNPILYCAMNKGYKKAALSVLYCTWRHTGESQQTNRAHGNDSSDTKRETLNCSRGHPKRVWSPRRGGGGRHCDQPKAIVVYSTFDRPSPSPCGGRRRQSADRSPTSGSAGRPQRKPSDQLGAELIPLSNVPPQARNRSSC